jgi:hypothetical protein
VQRNAISSVSIIEIAGKVLPGLLTHNETGYENPAIEVAENGYIRTIGSDNKKIKGLELSYLIKRNSQMVSYIRQWENEKKDRDVVLYRTDKTGNILNAYMREIFGMCELLDVLYPAFDEGARDKAVLNFKLAVFEYRAEPIGT